MNILYSIALLLVIVGAINWGAYALKFNLVTKLLGKIPYAEKAVYYLVALAGVYVAIYSLTSGSDDDTADAQRVRYRNNSKY